MIETDSRCFLCPSVSSVTCLHYFFTKYWLEFKKFLWELLLSRVDGHIAWV